MSIRWRPSAAAGLLGAWLATAAGAPEARAQGWDQGRNMFGFAGYHTGIGWNNFWYPGDGRAAYYSTRDGRNFFADRHSRDWHLGAGSYNRGGPRPFFNWPGQANLYNPYANVRPEQPGDRHRPIGPIRRLGHR